MFNPHLILKMLVTLGLVGGLGPASEVQAAHRARPIPALKAALRALESAEQTALVRRAENQLVDALTALGASVTVAPTGEPSERLSVDQDRRKLLRALGTIIAVQRDLQGDTSAPATAAKPHLFRAAVALDRAVIPPLLHGHTER